MPGNEKKYSTIKDRSDLINVAEIQELERLREIEKEVDGSYFTETSKLEESVIAEEKNNDENYKKQDPAVKVSNVTNDTDVNEAEKPVGSVTEEKNDDEIDKKKDSSEAIKIKTRGEIYGELAELNQKLYCKNSLIDDAMDKDGGISENREKFFKGLAFLGERGKKIDSIISYGTYSSEVLNDYYQGAFANLDGFISNINEGKSLFSSSRHHSPLDNISKNKEGISSKINANSACFNEVAKDVNDIKLVLNAEGNGVNGVNGVLVGFSFSESEYGKIFDKIKDKELRERAIAGFKADCQNNGISLDKEGNKKECEKGLAQFTNDLLFVRASIIKNTGAVLLGDVKNTIKDSLDTNEEKYFNETADNIAPFMATENARKTLTAENLKSSFEKIGKHIEARIDKTNEIIKDEENDLIKRMYEIDENKIKERLDTARKSFRKEKLNSADCMDDIQRLSREMKRGESKISDGTRMKANLIQAEVSSTIKTVLSSIKNFTTYSANHVALEHGIRRIDEATNAFSKRASGQVGFDYLNDLGEIIERGNLKNVSTDQFVESFKLNNKGWKKPTGNATDKDIRKLSASLDKLSAAKAAQIGLKEEEIRNMRAAIINEENLNIGDLSNNHTKNIYLNYKMLKIIEGKIWEKDNKEAERLENSKKEKLLNYSIDKLRPKGVVKKSLSYVGTALNNVIVRPILWLVQKVVNLFNSSTRLIGSGLGASFEKSFQEEHGSELKRLGFIPKQGLTKKMLAEFTNAGITGEIMGTFYGMTKLLTKLPITVRKVDGKPISAGDQLENALDKIAPNLDCFSGYVSTLAVLAKGPLMAGYSVDKLKIGIKDTSKEKKLFDEEQLLTSDLKSVKKDLFSVVKDNNGVRPDMLKKVFDSLKVVDAVIRANSVGAIENLEKDKMSLEEQLKNLEDKKKYIEEKFKSTENKDDVKEDPIKEYKIKEYQIKKEKYDDQIEKCKKRIESCKEDIDLVYMRRDVLLRKNDEVRKYVNDEVNKEFMMNPENNLFYTGEKKPDHPEQIIINNNSEKMEPRNGLKKKIEVKEKENMYGDVDEKYDSKAKTKEKINNFSRISTLGSETKKIGSSFITDNKTNTESKIDNFDSCSGGSKTGKDTREDISLAV